MNTKNSLKKSLMQNFILLVFISLVLINIFSSYMFKRFYYNQTIENAKDTLDMYVDYDRKFYGFTSNEKLKEAINQHPNLFYNNIDQRLEILDLDGTVLFDSEGYKYTTAPEMDKLIQNASATWIGRDSASGKRVLTVSTAVMHDEEPIYYLRLFFGLGQVDDFTNKLSIIIAAISLLVLLVCIIISNFISDSIVNPIKYLTRIAMRMSKGNYKDKSRLKLKNEIGALSNAMNILSDEIIKHDELKNEFIANISHELRTPLTSLTGWAYTLKDGELDQETTELAHDILISESERLSSLLEELLDFSSLISGKISLNKDYFDLKICVEDITKQVFPKLEKNKESIELNIADASYLYYGDENRIKQVLINLLDNAVKFNKERGLITVNLYQDKDSYFIDVIDEGVGIEEGELKYIFEKFYTGKKSKSHTGIGLAIVKEIVELHKGEIYIESKVDEGTKFTVKLAKEIKDEKAS
ncbi:sensor histidine kinase [Fenollaria sporofastidiosus]|uniref:sensor histidine kinase n=1 Tax=Fenollaria sporofastidiosus TaxID=2811778 RepID=UPI001C001657|nr:HAMP domain-containing sensor histidine kinase [Fenollaria sporofastidiosus]